MLGEGLLLVDACRGLGPTHVHAHFAHGPAAASYLAHLVAGTPYSFTAHAKDLYTTRADSVAQRAGAATFVATCTEANVRYLVDGGSEAGWDLLDRLPYEIADDDSTARARDAVAAAAGRMGRSLPAGGRPTAMCLQSTAAT